MAQSRPKIGLSLSGGGAKGLAHIGLLKVIDSAGIKIDYITGTSMGAVVGGLYAIGFTGNDLEYIVRSTNWDMIISNNVPMNEINIEEKDEFGRYLAELPMVKMKPTLPLGAIEGQELTKLLGDLTFTAHHISNFDSLPIPFRCVGADIITGETVILKKGYLPTAMRASMAIPSVFTPVKVDGHLLVDGGLLNNFPVREVREMGADIVIGGYTGGRLYNEEQLNSAIKLIYQSASFTRIADSKEQMKLCNILTDYDLELQNYSTASFKNADSIIAIGYRIALQKLPDLKRLADSLKQHGNNVEQPQQRGPQYSICISKINIEGATPQSLSLLKGKLNMEEGRTYRVEDINRMIEMVYGTRFFDKVYYTLELTPYGNQITIHVQESRRASFKFGLHYDNEQAAGILANLTLRNKLGKGSRFVATFDIAEYPKIRLMYQQFLNKKQNLWYQGGYHYEFTPYRIYNFGRLQEEFTNGYSNFYVGINKTLNKNSYFGLMVNWETNLTRTKIKPEDRALPGQLTFRKLNSQEVGISLHYTANTLNSFLFPTMGHKTQATIKYVPSHTYVINFYTDNPSFANNTFEYDTFLTPVIKFSLSHKEITPIHKKISWINTLFAGIMVDDFINKGEPYSLGALTGRFLVGGVEQRQRQNNVPFIGYRDAELLVAQALVYSTSLQIEILKKLYLSPSIALQATGINYNSYIKNITDFNFNYQDFSRGANHALGYGITFAYDWFGGPISFTFYKSTRVTDYRGYFTYGYKF